ncbi:hypothetical protein CRUP_006730 [Coryphaenoides rupestris]|nr:hypothetical protein CRUP_006730 [Coryphaenoides rupestris]
MWYPQCSISSHCPHQHHRPAQDGQGPLANSAIALSVGPNPEDCPLCALSLKERAGTAADDSNGEEEEEEGEEEEEEGDGGVEEEETDREENRLEETSDGDGEGRGRGRGGRGRARTRRRRRRRRTERRTCFGRCKDAWDEMRRKLWGIVESKYFSRGIMIAILINTISMGIEHHNQVRGRPHPGLKTRLLPSQPEELTNVLEICNIVFTSMFTLEMVLKLTAFGFFDYLRNPYNIFDGIIVIIRWRGEIIGQADGGLSVLRTFRLLRVIKLVRFMPALRRQLVVLMKTMDNVATFCMLLMLFIFIFSILGMHIFGCKFSLKTEAGDTVPDRKNFDSLLWAIVTVFQLGERRLPVTVLVVRHHRRPTAAAAHAADQHPPGEALLPGLAVGQRAQRQRRGREREREGAGEGEGERGQVRRPRDLQQVGQLQGERPAVPPRHKVPREEQRWEVEGAGGGGGGRRRVVLVVLVEEQRLLVLRAPVEVRMRMMRVVVGGPLVVGGHGGAGEEWVGVEAQVEVGEAGHLQPSRPGLRALWGGLGVSLTTALWSRLARLSELTLLFLEPRAQVSLSPGYSAAGIRGRSRCPLGVRVQILGWLSFHFPSPHFHLI